jgi:hypothetical protein
MGRTVMEVMDVMGWQVTIVTQVTGSRKGGRIEAG